MWIWCKFTSISIAYAIKCYKAEKETFLSKRKRAFSSQLALKFVSPSTDGVAMDAYFFFSEIAFDDCHAFALTHNCYLFDQYSIAFKLFAPPMASIQTPYICTSIVCKLFMMTIYFCDQFSFVRSNVYGTACAHINTHEEKVLSFKTIENSYMENKVLKLKRPNFVCANINDRK